MSIITVISSIKKKETLICYLVLFSLFMSENMVSLNRWDRNFVRVDYVANEHSIKISFLYYNFSFGPFGEHGYLEFMKFAYSVDGLTLQTLMVCSTENQERSFGTWLTLAEKLPGAKLKYIEYHYHAPDKGGIDWPEGATIRQHNLTTSETLFFEVKWFLLSTQKIKEIFVTGTWRVTGLNCPDIIKGEVYEIPYLKSLNTELKTESQQINVNDQRDKNAVKVCKETGAVVVKGANPGLKINIYSASGVQIKSVIANQEEVKIKLPNPQVYILEIGRARCKIAL